jgi:hypothetical protein
MGAKDWMVFYAERDVPDVLREAPTLDRDATQRLVHQLFPGKDVVAIDDVSLAFANPPDDRVHAAVWPGATVVCAGELALDRPSTLDRRFLHAGAGRTLYLHAMHSVVDWFAFAVWGPDGQLRRALSVLPDRGVIEDVGVPMPFEQSFWAGEHPAVDPGEDDPANPCPIPFDPLELAEEALATLFGFVYEGPIDRDPVDPETIALAAFSVAERKRRLFGRGR